MPSKPVDIGYCELMGPVVGPMVITVRFTDVLACGGVISWGI